MPSTLTGVAANGAADPISISAPAAGDSFTSAPIRTALQKILDTIQRIRADFVTKAAATPAWTSVDSYGTNWSAGLGGLSAWKDPSGKIHLKGGATAASSASTTAATLAAGVRPAATRYVTAPMGSATLVWAINADGTVTLTNALGGGAPAAPSVGYTVSFDGVSFFA